MIVYTTIGGVQAVAWTDVKQMFIVVGGMSAAVAILLYGILQHVELRPGAAPGRRDRPAERRSTSVQPAARPTRSGRG